MPELIHSTKEILIDLDNHIKTKKPFSLIRIGDGCLGLLSVLKETHERTGKWAGRKGFRVIRNTHRRIGIPEERWQDVVDLYIQMMNEANYVGSYDAFLVDELIYKAVGDLCKNCKLIHRNSGIMNESYCSPYFHYFSIVEGEMNLFDVMRGRRVMCMTDRVHVIPKLKEKSGASLIDYIFIPDNSMHFNNYFKVCAKQIMRKSQNYDLWLIGGGYLGKIYTGLVKKYRGRALDIGRLFSFWAGERKVDSRPKRFIKYNPETLLCERIRGEGKIW